MAPARLGVHLTGYGSRFRKLALQAWLKTVIIERLLPEAFLGRLMDVASVLEEYLADITSLPGDLAFILDEIRVKDAKLVEAQKRIQQRDGAVQKFVKSSGAVPEYPKEQALYPKIRSDYQECITLQQEKTRLAIMGLYLVSKQVSKLDDQVQKLEVEGMLPPLVADLDDSASMASASASPEPRPRKSMSAGDGSRRASTRAESVSSSHDRRSETPAVSGGGASGGAAGGDRSTPHPPETSRVRVVSGSDENQRDALQLNGARVSLKRSHGSPRQRFPIAGEEGDEAFCYCKKGSVGNMIACDSDSCSIEWFHWECVGLTEDPKGSWHCPDCRERLKKAIK